MSSQSEMARTPRIVVGVDGSEESVAALRWAHAEGEAHQKTVEAVLVWGVPRFFFGTPGTPAIPVTEALFDTKTILKRAEETLQEALESAFGEKVPGLVETSVAEGDPAAVLIGRSVGADLLALGSRGHGGFKGVGSVTEQCVKQARCTVVVVRGNHSL
jgi:nucleotide-binding universal stress UspA family protein